MKRKSSFALFLIVVGACVLVAAPSEKQNWTNYVRIGAYGLKGGDAAEIVRRGAGRRRLGN